jgi:hypothetical protein
MHHNSNKRFTIRKIFANEQDLENWNLCTLQRELSSARKDKALGERLHCSSIAIDFETNEKAEKFELELKAIAGVRLRQVDAVKQVHQRTISEAYSSRPLSGTPASVWGASASNLNVPKTIVFPSLQTDPLTTQHRPMEFSLSDDETDESPVTDSSEYSIVQMVNNSLRSYAIAGSHTAEPINMERMKQLVQSPNIDSVIKSIRDNSVELMDSILDLGFDVNNEETGKLPLHWATAFDNVEMIKHLLVRGARVDTATRCWDPKTWQMIQQECSIDHLSDVSLFMIDLFSGSMSDDPTILLRRLMNSSTLTQMFLRCTVELKGLNLVESIRNVQSIDESLVVLIGTKEASNWNIEATTYHEYVLKTWGSDGWTFIQTIFQQLRLEQENDKARSKFDTTLANDSEYLR